MNGTMDRKGSNLMSASKLSTYLGCPKKYWFNYFSPVERVAPNINLLFGSHIHKILEQNDKRFMTGAGFEEVEILQDIFSRDFVEEASKTPNITKQDIDKHVKIGVGLIREYYHCMSIDNYYPTHSEEEFKIELTQVPVTLYGFVDKIIQEEEGDVIIDIKTSRCMYNEGAILEKRQQLLTYAIWYRKKFKKKEKAVGLDVLIKTKEPKIQQVRFQFSDTEIAEGLQTMDIVQEHIKKGKFNPSYQGCNWCDFRGCCRTVIPHKPLDSLQQMILNKKS